MTTFTLLIVFLLALVPMPFLPILRGDSSTAPFVKARVIICSLWIAWVVSTITLALYSATVFYILASLAATAFAFSWVRGRASYGHSAGLPKGSLALSQSLMAIVDRDYYFKAGDRYGPVFKMSQFHQPTVCVIGLARGHRLFRDHQESFGPVSQPFNRSVAGGFLRYMDDDTHGVYARLFGKALALPAITSAVPDVEAASRAALQAMAERCQAKGVSGVSPRVFCDQLTYDAFARVLFGINAGTDAYEEMRAAYAGLKAYNIGSKVDRATEQSLESLRSLLRRHARSLIASQTSSPTCTLTELHRLDATMPDDVCVDNLLFILKISTANVSSLMLWLFKMLGEHPDWMRRLAEAQRGEGEDSHDQNLLADSVVKETLRLAQSEYLYRGLLEDVQFDGLTLPKGWLVRLCVRESHGSEAVFANPLDFDPARFLHKKVGVTAYAPFGYGTHSCNGIALNDLICRAFLQTMASGFTWTITHDGPLQRGFRHWSHWQPSADLRVQLVVAVNQ